MRKIIVLLFLFSINAYSQSVVGNVTDIDKTPLLGVNIYLTNTSNGTQTDLNGNYTLKAKQGNYTLVASYVGYKTFRKQISLQKDIELTLDIVLEISSESLETASVEGKTKAQQVREKAFEVDVLEIDNDLKNSNYNINTALKGVSGINIRRTGGLGSSFEFSMNGLSGRQVKFFIDGIPLDNLGSSLSLDNFPVNLIDRVDIFKGVVPVYLGSDALGGAINIVTKQNREKYLDVSYSFGSFNTHIASVLGQYYDEKSGFLGKISSFYNYSDNNYKIDNIDVTDDLGNIIGQVNDVERPHDAYNSVMAKAEVGFANRKFADEILVGVLFSGNNNEIQHSLDYQKPFGEFETKENLRQLSLVYKKDDVLKNLDIKVFGSISKNAIKTIDTSSFTYNWLKERIPNRSGGGELGLKKLSTFNDKIHLINTSLNYNLFDKHKHQLIFNYTKNFIERTGTDEVPKPFIAFEMPHTIDKHIAGLSYDFKLLDNAWSSSIFTKYYTLKINGIDIDPFKPDTDPDKIINVNNQFNEFGYGLATTYKFNKKMQLKASYEHAYRLPEGYEVFGDGALLESNVNLQPEKSDNFNFGGIYSTNFAENFKLKLDVNGFYRDVKNLIVLQAKVITQEHVNAFDAKVLGVEGDINLEYKNSWALKANITKQTKTQVLENETIKIPNIPFLFGNINLQYSLKEPFKNNDRLRFALITRFVDEYPLRSYTSGDANKPVIEGQLSQDFSVNYSFNKEKYNLSLSVNNLWDSALYDNFNLQQPGRALYLKFRYVL